MKKLFFFLMFIATLLTRKGIAQDTLFNKVKDALLDDKPFKSLNKTDYTEEMLAIGSVVKNRLNWVKDNPSDKDSFCGDTYLKVISCVNKWGQSQFLSYNNSKYKQFINNKIPNEIQQRFANACIEAAKTVIKTTPESYKEFMGFNQSSSQSPFSAARTIKPPTKIGAHYFWKLKK
jgi:hypothetical protein